MTRLMLMRWMLIDGLMNFSRISWNLLPLLVALALVLDERHEVAPILVCIFAVPRCALIFAQVDVPVLAFAAAFARALALKVTIPAARPARFMRLKLPLSFAFVSSFAPPSFP